MCVEFPEIVVPDFLTELVTTTPMYDGTPLDGGGLLPPVVVHELPQLVAGVVVGSVITPAKPLSEGGALPPLRRFCCDHVSPHHSTLALPAVDAVMLPSVKAPLLGKANTIAVAVALAAW